MPAVASRWAKPSCQHQAPCQAPCTRTTVARGSAASTRIVSSATSGDRPEAGAQDPQVADRVTLGPVVRLLLGDVGARRRAEREPVGDVRGVLDQVVLVQ